MKSVMRRLLAMLLCFVLIVPLSGCLTLLANQVAYQQKATAASCSQLAEVAEQEYAENGNVAGGGAKYWGHWGKGVEPWCADFVYYCADQLGLVGADAPFGSYTASCLFAWNQLSAQGACMFAVGQTDPMPGDVVFFYHTSGGCATSVENPEHLAHVGIVVGYESGALTTVEGNCGGAGSAQNIVSRNVYSDMRGQCWSGAAIYGFARIQTSGQSLVDMVKTFESFTKYPVWDYAQYSVGYGTACPADKLEEYRQNGIPEDEAEELLAYHLQLAAAAVDQFAADNGLQLTTAQRDALTSLSYNIGSGWTTSADYQGFRTALCQPTSDLMLVQAFAKLSHAGGEILPGLVQRRICEAHLWLTGEYITDYTQSGYDYMITGGVVCICRREDG